MHAVRKRGTGKDQAGLARFMGVVDIYSPGSHDSSLIGASVVVGSNGTLGGG